MCKYMNTHIGKSNAMAHTIIFFSVPTEVLSEAKSDMKYTNTHVKNTQMHTHTITFTIMKHTTG